MALPTSTQVWLLNIGRWSPLISLTRPCPGSDLLAAILSPKISPTDFLELLAGSVFSLELGLKPLKWSLENCREDLLGVTTGFGKVLGAAFFAIFSRNSASRRCLARSYLMNSGVWFWLSEGTGLGLCCLGDILLSNIPAKLFEDLRNIWDLMEAQLRNISPGVLLTELTGCSWGSQRKLVTSGWSWNFLHFSFLFTVGRLRTLPPPSSGFSCIDQNLVPVVQSW